MRQLIVLGVLVPLLGTVARAQVTHNSATDTVQHRWLRSTLNDNASTFIFYEIGQMRLTTSSGYRFLHFKDSIGNPETGFLIGEDFVPASGDSLYYSRTANFDDNTKWGGTAPHLTQAQADSAAQAFISSYENKEFSPSSTYFASHTHVKFITELRNAGTNSVVVSLDTVDCYVNGAGALRYQNYPQGLNWRLIRVSDYVSPPTAVYLAVRIERTNVPTGATWTTVGGHDYFEGEESIHRRLKPKFQEATWLTAWTTCNAKRANGSAAAARELLKLRLVHNVEGRVEIEFESSSDQQVSYSIYDLKGVKMSGGVAALKQGRSSISIADADLPAGFYILHAENEAVSGSIKFSPIK